MIELRWVVRISVPNSEWSLPTKSKVLQYRTIIPHASSFKTKWTDWQDVPTVS